MVLRFGVMEPRHITIVTPQAASWLWQISDARMRRLALDGKLAYRIVHGLGSKRSRAYDFAACVERWGEPDPDRLEGLLRISSLQVTAKGGAVFELLTPRPVVLDHAGDLSTDLE